MGSSMTVIEEVLILFIIIVIGIIARKRGIITDEVRSGLSRLILDITLPLWTLASFNQSFSLDMLYNTAYIFAFSFIIHGVSFVLSKLFYYKYPDNMQGVLRCATAFSNTGFMGFPVLQGIFGSLGVFYASIYNIPFNLFLYSLGITLFTKEEGRGRLKKVLLNPAILATFIGLVTFITPLKFPGFLIKTFDMVGSTTTPLSMIIIGALLGDVRIKDLFSGFAVFYCSLMRLVVLPAVVFAVLRLFGADRMLTGMVVLLSAMPAATMTAILAERYGANASFASKCVFVTTVLSIVTIPLAVLII